MTGDWRPALRGLATRLLGPAGESVEFATLAGDGSRAYEYRCAGGVLTIRGSDGVAAAAGLHAYLKDRCGSQICWDTPLPLRFGALPEAPATGRDARVQAGYYLNFCTFSYTTAYWDWPRWEREIDWMALHGITMPLALTGHEATLYDVYTGMGLGDTETRRFLGGPGYLPFQYMGTLDGFAGAPSRDWVRRHADLGARIVARERSFGMTPILPGFTGHVPAALAGAGTSSRDWQGFRSYFLDPADRRFADLSSRIVAAQTRRLGTDHLYAADPFIEMTPPSTDPGYLAELARTILAGLRTADERATWVMQSWPFTYLGRYWTDERVAALLDAVPDDALLLLDLWAEHSPQWTRFGGFRGKRWIWCGLHDFGGRGDLFGDLAGARDGLAAALAAAEPPTGIGLAMEATETNPVVYELICDQQWERVDDLTDWVASFAARRYGEPLPDTVRCWRFLAESVYSAPPDAVRPQAFAGVLWRSPGYDRLDPDAARRRIAAAEWYDPALLRAAWESLLRAAEGRPDLLDASLGHDLVSVTATAMARAIDELHLAVVRAFAERSAGLAAAGERFLDAFVELDSLLDTRPEFRLHTWQEAAASWAVDADDRATLADNARRIVTVWTGFEPPVSPLDDYSARPWSGLVGSYYHARWRAWLTGLADALAAGEAPDGEALRVALHAHTREFVRSGPQRPAHRDTSTLVRARRLFDRYAELLTEAAR